MPRSTPLVLVLAGLGLGACANGALVAEAPGPAVGTTASVAPPQALPGRAPLGRATLGRAPLGQAPVGQAPLGKVPWQVAPASAETARVHGDVPEMTQVEGWGPVLATRRVLATFPADLPARPGRNRVIDPCWDAVAGAAARVGPAFVEMASRGPERRVGSDRYEGMVEVRIIWTREGHREVRQATMRCVTTDEGQLLDAAAIYPIDREDGSDIRRPA